MNTSMKDAAAADAAATDLAKRHKVLLRTAFTAAVSRSLPDAELREHLPPVPRKGRLVVLGAGKAAAHMGKIAENHYAALPGRHRIDGLIVTPHGMDADVRLFKHLAAAHPFPDRSSEAAARRMIEMVRGLSAEDHVLMLISGGASSLLCAPADAIGFAGKRAITQALFLAGADIDDLNTVRKFLSAIKGGKLARLAAPAAVTTLAISDVVGDDPAVIGSAPTFDSTPSLEDVRTIFARHGLVPPRDLERVAADHAAMPLAGPTRYTLVARPIHALHAAASVAEKHGYLAVVLGDDIEGEARLQATLMTETLAAKAAEFRAPIALLAGGEVTVNLSASPRIGYGGPNREFALALAICLREAGLPGVSGLVADTDGVDGCIGKQGAVAGAIVDSGTIARAREIGLDPLDALDAHDSGTFFEALGDEFVTGPTGTNVNDFRMLLCR